MRLPHHLVVRAAMVIPLAVGLGACSDEVDPPVEANVLVAPQVAGAPQGDPGAGGSIFVTSCAACHGAEGGGGFGPDLTDSAVAQDYQAVVEQVRDGQGAMPAFDPVLTTSQIEDVAAYVTQRVVDDPKVVEAITPSGGASPSAVPPSIDPTEGAEIFAQTCASCHGDQGDGTEVAPPIPEDLGFASVRSVVAGGALGMPAFTHFLGASEIDAVTAYVVTELGESPNR